MLEPFLRPRAGQALHALAAVACLVFAFGEAGVTTASGHVPAFVIMPILAVFFILRLAGISAGEWRDLKEMPWGYRVSSWAALAVSLLVLGSLFRPTGGAFFAGFVVLDAAGAISPKRPGESDRTSVVADRVGAWVARRAVWLAVLYVAGFVVLHLFFAATVPYGALVDWTYLAIGFALLLRFGAVGARVPDEAARPPVAHRVHVARSRVLADPVTREAAAACDAFLREGDAGPLLDTVRAATRHAHLSIDEARALETRVLAALSRAGTTREEDLEAAVAALEGALTVTAGASRSIHSSAPGGVP